MVLFRHSMRRFVREGSLEIQTSNGESFIVGDGSPPSCGIRLADVRAELELLFDPEMALGELYAAGRMELTRGGLADLLAIGARNVAAPGKARPIAAWQAVRRLRQRAAAVAPRRARANAAYHYDLDTGLYRLFLDDDLQYSCAFFETPSDSLEAAQLAKKRHIAAKLAVSPGMTALEIGCGWGGLALYLASRCGVAVKGVTLADEQLGVARRRAAAAGLAGRVEFALEDYRETHGRFDRIVSVAMFEHVGPRKYDAFFKAVADLLAEDGVALIHTIGHCGLPVPTSPWMRKYIFPDGYIPSLAEIARAVARAGLLVADLEILREHYALTLEHWRARFAARRDEAKAIYGERFCRIWEFYLAASQSAFRHLGFVVFQLQLTKKPNVLPITRDYIAEREADLRGSLAFRQPRRAARS
ncbi:cyclopropane-fatty-acyl-phospholipid synthase family protein [Rhodoblastus acidophilus]|uniref:Cyclopropane-fatty-acyl-phospholipid synthase family protein n=1 Tax=Candidatus Rhodoblastus alkanivorans TaxID=2954117 RepID=A0ABS9ZA75_9HYPH|nr:cyclopropane-fatty-acyl-phospholipid synthase family protein [Candidatus Rhodoblastus alkanivorans]MCI4677195.1 cyclopropane-fatty-acyl-phospholipid synthase family protein [Candidatus Rhodoblastus alkanivorans]MCI4684548.1 cyclopropane-fatty-acyl-phospholipid synthase family protein [Candidatus Rhodoblastus alkanivorans]MDI4641869.1 cyclopropane-fatty-acyl-phospholipid synthase family protein [Rhodoblastus acidophilus]